MENRFVEYIIRFMGGFKLHRLFMIIIKKL